ncbi:hypothetical protein [Escherichia coli]|uniref:hypothetical protein n=1 Tax=Escherichia coli TaxID=562 RepID=UPI00200A11EF|nr:hypothetical protein [Escherichia coli]MEB3720339.1 hypothetical protein [Escherichia coli]
MRQQVLILAGSQAIFQSISVLIMTIGGLAGALLTPNPSLVTVPISMASLGTVLVMFPASLWMDRAGRKTGFITGTLSGIMAAVISMVAMIQDSFILLCLGMFFLGIYQAFAQFSVLLRVKLRCRHSAPGPFRWFWLAVLLLPC